MEAGGAPDKKTVRVLILNQPYTLKASGDPKEIEEAAAMVDELMTSITRMGAGDPARAAVLACLHLADQLRGVQRDLARLKDRVESKSRHLSSLLEDLDTES